MNFALETIGVEGILKLVDGKPRDCELRHCLAYLDKMLSEPIFFESRTEGILSNIQRGEMRDYYLSKLFLVFIPKNAIKTLAEMSEEEFRKYRQQRDKGYFATKFAEWLSKR